MPDLCPVAPLTTRNQKPLSNISKRTPTPFPTLENTPHHVSRGFGPVVDKAESSEAGQQPNRRRESSCKRRISGSRSRYAANQKRQQWPPARGQTRRPATSQWQDVKEQLGRMRRDTSWSLLFWRGLLSTNGKNNISKRASQREHLPCHVYAEVLGSSIYLYVVIYIPVLKS